MMTKLQRVHMSYMGNGRVTRIIASAAAKHLTTIWKESCEH